MILDIFLCNFRILLEEGNPHKYASMGEGIEEEGRCPRGGEEVVVRGVDVRTENGT